MSFQFEKKLLFNLCMEKKEKKYFREDTRMYKSLHGKSQEFRKERKTPPHGNASKHEHCLLLAKVYIFSFSGSITILSFQL